MVVEDNDDDMEAIERSLRRSQPGPLVHRLLDGTALVEWLMERATLPELVLLDLGLPSGNGRHAIEAVKRTPAIAHPSVVVLTGTADPDEVAACHAAGADGYLVKASGFALLHATLAAAMEYWLRWTSARS
ncbi:response regulator [Actinoplanes sp. RD1]|uniref:response regulator n=1 Tax=Actinoplanes sp. RD1 TaxID=3064538 RepID=UPI0027420F3B|nr:response regulator [Actinoplanes sp. RD1]